MFGLPLSTTLLVFGFPAFWILYTIAFLFLTRHRKRQPPAREDAP